VKVKTVGADELRVTGPVGAGESTEVAPGEKNAYAGPSPEMEKATVSPLLTETEGRLGTRTPVSFERKTSVCAIVSLKLFQIISLV
jgi:hypothetical protein